MGIERRTAGSQRRVDDKELMEMKHEIMETHRLAQEAAGRVSMHEEICAERFQGILRRFDRAEKVVYSGITILIGAMGTVIIMLINLIVK